MLVSTKGRYALRVMLSFAARGGGEYVALSAVAREQDISEKYLESIIALLVKGGLVEGLRGKGGGYRLTRAADEYSVGEILRLTEGSLAPVACLSHGKDGCERAATCLALPLWEKLDALICGYLDSVTLVSLLKPPEGDENK